MPYPNGYTELITNLARQDSRIRLAGSLWDQDLLDTLYAHTALYLHGHSVGGTNPSLLRAMGAGAPVAAYDVSFNREVLATDDPAYWTDPDEVAAIFDSVESAQSAWQPRGAAGRERIAETYRWDDIASGYERLAIDLLNGKKTRSMADAPKLRAALKVAKDPARGAGPWIRTSDESAKDGPSTLPT